jgi:hypothetical protein
VVVYVISGREGWNYPSHHSHGSHITQSFNKTRSLGANLDACTIPNRCTRREVLTGKGLFSRQSFPHRPDECNHGS